LQEARDVLFEAVKRLDVEIGLSGFGQAVGQEFRHVLDRDPGQKLLRGLYLPGRNEGDLPGRAASAFFNEEVGDLEWLGYLPAVGVEVELHLTLMPATVEPIVVGQERGAGSEGDHAAIAAGGFPDGIGGQNICRPLL